ncbi:hypothetical protein [Methylobacterium durans]|uniref:Uncharacterized protein n=1 Tax=Methylobacterium durans TaxID=2202825 RepID=A0A2U8W7Z0_9HYPH|nr:hypothetical protein [Methylobacterium durans]AWN42235.1 hypothetical protein DK389_19180 [Methylobacterium durans]
MIESGRYDGTCGGILFRNDDWTLSKDGLEHRSGYFIDRDALGQRREENLWAWPLHMAEKRWCTPSLFREAFLVALDRFGIARDAELAPSFAVGIGIRAGQGVAGEGFVSLSEIVRPRPQAGHAGRAGRGERRAAKVSARA